MNKTLELATARVRLFPSTYKKIREQAKKKRTSSAQIIDEKFKKYGG